MGLTNEDREALDTALDWHFEDAECCEERDGQAFWITTAVEQIIARHVTEARAAALNEAADALEHLTIPVNAVAGVVVAQNAIRNLATLPPP